MHKARSNDGLIKHDREVSPAIRRYPCKGNLTMKIDLHNKRAIISIKHQSNHPKPDHREINVSLEAATWIKDNLNYGLRKVEFYKRLSHLGLIDPKVHTYQQIYYWVAKWSNKQFVTDTKNQLKSSKNFLEQNVEENDGYKVIYYLENDYVRSLGFITPFLQLIGRNNITELIIDSTYKTNQEHFELFAVVANNGGYGVPLAYLYMDTFVPSEDLPNSDSDNRIQNREGVLCEFFLALRQENILPVFVLVDKDAGQINAIEAAWDKKAVIQICLWHIEHAIQRKMQERREKASQYKIETAQAANRLFQFVDAQWIPSNNSSIFCPEEYKENVLTMVKRHALVHPLIPVRRDTFLTKDQIYHQSVYEIYQFCRSKDLTHLWGYLWCNWYQKKHWDRFA